MANATTERRGVDGWVAVGYFTALGTSLNIKPVLSDDDTYDAVIGSEGGTMVAEGPDLRATRLSASSPGGPCCA